MTKTKTQNENDTAWEAQDAERAAMDQHHWDGPLRTVVHDHPLPVFQGWTIDWGRRECRRNDPDQGTIVYSFDTPEGQALLMAWMEWNYL